jgi:hypothetical protein
MHLSVGAGLLANAVVLLWGRWLDVDRSHPPCGNAVLDASRHLDDADAGLGVDWLANACIAICIAEPPRSPASRLLQRSRKGQ